jgi:DNA-binding XRE family transcriptional regulator
MKRFSPRKLAALLNDPRVRIAGVAKVAGITVQTLYAVRDGKNSPKSETVAAIAFALNKPIDYFYEEESVLAQHQLSLGERGVANG